MLENIAGPLIILVFLGTFALILAEVTHRTLVAWVGATIVCLIGKVTGSFDEAELAHAVDFDVLGLLLGMMVIASNLEMCGFFEYIAIKGTKMAKGDPWRLVVILGTFTTAISLVIDNVTAIIIIAPITVRICNKMEINPIPLLMCEAILANTGGVATLVGDPPNVMIAAEMKYTFISFMKHLFIMSFMAWVATLAYIRWYYRDWINVKPKHVEDIMKEDEWAAVKNRGMMNRTLIALGITIVFFSSVEILHLHIHIATISLMGAGLTLALNNPDIEKVVKHVEWTALLFFVGLFVLVGSLEAMGYLEEFGLWIYHVSGEGEHPILLAVMVLWVAAIASAIVDNIPFTAAMIPTLKGLAVHGINVHPLMWALAMGAGFGGNATPIGSSANVVTVAISERSGKPISAVEWMRVGLPVMLITCTVATIFLVIDLYFFEMLYPYP